jgi:FMN phosphatase YigB (HAD superfamily)
MNNKPILFVDFDGTICHERYWRSLPSLHHQAVQDLIFKSNTQMVHDWMRGKYSAEEVNQFIADTIGIPFEGLWELFVKDCVTMHVSPHVLDQITELRKKYFVILMTGNMDSFTRFTVPALNLESCFDHISNSYYEGRHKTDDTGQLFLDYAERYKVPFSECIMIDNSEKVCSLVRELGGRAYHVTPELGVEHYLLKIAEL